MLPSLDYVISTYELSPRTSEKILRIAARQIKTLGITSFDEQYRYVASLVEKFHIWNYRERRNNRLDQLEGWQLDRFFGSLLDNPNGFSVGEEEPTTLGLALEDSIDQVYSSLPSKRRKKPGRPSRYNGNPLAYFREHEEMFRGMSRIGLAFEYPALSSALYRAHQIHLAIPRIIDRSIPSEEKDSIVKSFESSGRNIAVTAREVGRPAHSVRAFLIRTGNLTPRKATHKYEERKYKPLQQTA